MNFEKSKKAFNEAQKSIPGGVNSPARAYRSVKSTPPFIASSKGSKIFDIDGNQFIDYVGSWGPMILGNTHDSVIEAITKTAMAGTSFGAPTLLETAMAEKIKAMVPSVEKVRMVNSGTEATLSAIRLARGYTGREMIIKFEGCYHGHSDSFLIKAGSGALTQGTPDSPGVTKGTAQTTLIANFNDLDSVKHLFQKNPDNIAAVIVEPITGNMGVVKPQSGFLEGLRTLCDQYGSVLIFDEVMTGFRVAKGGAQELLKVKPDLTTFGKIIGGGLPVGAFGGKKEVMAMLAPEGPVYQAGTLSGNPLAMSAGLTTLTLLDENKDFYIELEKKSQTLEEGIKGNLKKLSFPAVINRVGSMMTLFFHTTASEINTFSDVMQCNTELFANYFNQMLAEGIYLPPSQFEALFVSIAHSEVDIEQTVQANYKVLKNLSKEIRL